VKLSIVIPCFDVAAEVGCTIAAIAAQSRRDFEVIVVNDGSRDGSGDAAAVAALECGISSFTRLDIPHAGVSAARNRGLAAATGEYVLFLDGDDLIVPDLVERVLGQVARADRLIDVVCWRWDVVDRADDIVGSDVDRPPSYGEILLAREALSRRVGGRLRIWTASAAYRRAFLDRVALRFTEGCVCGEDLEFSYRALSRADSVATIDDVLSFYVRRRDSATNRRDVSRFDSVLALRRVEEALLEDERADIREIGVEFARSKVLRNFFFTLESLIGKDASVGRARTFDEIEHRFPGILDDVRRRTRSWPPPRLSGLRRVFAISPTLWWLLQHWRSVRTVRGGKGPEARA
jgi:glycosyltransferase involved in cell wall biosynthesis